MRFTIAGLLFPLSLILILYAGCAAPAETIERPADLPAAFPHHSAQDIVFEVNADTDDIHAFTGRAQLNINSPTQRGSYSATLHNRRADSLLLSVSQFGFDGLRALITPDSFYVYDVLRNRLSYGSVNDAARSFPIPIGSDDDIFRTLIGAIVPQTGPDWILNAGGRYYTLANAQQGRTLVVDPSIWRVIRYEERNAAGELIEERLYSDFQEFDGAILPRRVSINVPELETSVTLVYRNISVNPSSLDFELQVNRTAERVRAGSGS